MFSVSGPVAMVSCASLVLHRRRRLQWLVVVCVCQQLRLQLSAKLGKVPRLKILCPLNIGLWAPILSALREFLKRMTPVQRETVSPPPTRIQRAVYLEEAMPRAYC